MVAFKNIFKNQTFFKRFGIKIGYRLTRRLMLIIFPSVVRVETVHLIKFNSKLQKNSIVILIYNQANIKANPKIIINYRISLKLLCKIREHKMILLLHH